MFKNFNDKNVALVGKSNIMDISDTSNMKSLLNFLEDNLFNKILKKGYSEGRLLLKLLECNKFDRFRDIMNSTKLSVEEVDNIVLLNI